LTDFLPLTGFHSTALLSLNPALTFALFQLFRRALALFSRRSAGGTALTVKPGPLESFLGAAISNTAGALLRFHF
jgi:adenine nucleotide transporter 17